MDVPVYSVAHTAIAAGSTTWGQLFGTNSQVGFSSALNRVNVDIQGAGTFRNLASYVRANTSTAGTATISTYLSPSTVGNCTLSWTDTSTGWFEDTSHTDSFDDGEKWAIRAVGFTTGVLTITCLQGLFQNISGQFQILTNRLLDFGSQNGTRYSSFAAPDNSFTTVATNDAANIPFGGVLRNLHTNCDSYGRTGGTYNRLGTYCAETAALGNVTVTISSAAAFEDTSNTDTVTAGERWCLAYTTDHTAGACRLRGEGARIELHPTAANFLFLATRGPEGGNSDLDCSLPISGGCCRWSTVNDTRANMQHRADVAFTWSNLWANSLGAAAIIRSDINGAGAAGAGNGNQTITMAAGEVTDSVNTDAVAVGDLLSWGNDYQSGRAYSIAMSSMGAAIAVVGAFNVAQADSAAVVDSQTATITMDHVQVEPIAVADILLASMSPGVAQSESVALTESQNGFASLNVTRVESYALTESQTALTSMSATRVESSGVGDVYTTAAIMAGVIAESNATTENHTASMTSTVVQAESTVTTAVQDGVIAAGDVNAVRTESVTVSDASTSLYTIVASLIESSSIAETAVRTAIMARVVGESASASESVAATASMLAVIAEAGAVLDAATAQLLLFATYSETVGATDLSDGDITLELSAACLELMTVMDYPIGVLLRDETFEDRLFMAVNRVYNAGLGQLPARLKLDAGLLDRIKDRL